MKHFFLTKFLMVIGGFWKLQFKSFNDRQWLYYKLYSVSLQIYFIVLLISMYAGVIPVWYTDRPRAIECIGIIVFCTIVFLKVIMCQRSGITQIFHNGLAFDKESDKLDKNDFKIYKSYAKYTIYVIVGLFTCSSLCGVTRILSQFIIYKQQKKEVTLGLTNITEVERPLPYVLWRPVIFKDHYVIAFIADIVLAVIGCTFNSITQAIYISLMTFMIGQLKILQNKFRNYGNRCSQEVNFKNKFSILRNLILEHKKIITLVETLDENLSYLLLVEFSINSFQITTFLYEIVAVELDAGIIFRLTFLSCMLLQVFILAWLASKIRENSIELSQAIYECEWYDVPEKLKQYLIIILVRAQRPLTISIGPFFVLTNSTAVTTLKAAYSYLAILNRRKQD